MIGELGNIEMTLGMSGSIMENVKDVKTFLDTPIGTLGKTLGCIGKTSSSIKKKELWGIFIFFQGTKNGCLMEPKRCWGHIEQCHGDIKDIHPSTSGKLHGCYGVFGKFQGTPNFFSFGRWRMMGMPRKCNEDVGQG
jgi:hypothetical protein